jgi:gag-polypeptide of LTR copia-type
MTQLLGSKGLTGYIDGHIVKPAMPSSDAVTPDHATPIYSSKPTYDEWVFRDQLTRGHVTLNCTDVAGLGIKSTGTAKEAWDSIQSEWGKSTDMRRSHAQEALDRTLYAEDSSIQEHIKLLRTRKAAVDNLSTSAMTEETWKGIVIRSIPPTTKWLPVIPSLYAMTTTADVFSTLIAHEMVLDRGMRSKPTSGTSTSTALVAKSSNPCANPNCKAKKKSSHSTENCYWPGGGKEGQFPPNFGQRTRANVVSTNQCTAEHFVLSARVLDSLGNSGVIFDNDEGEANNTMALISKGFQSFGGGKMPTFIARGHID